ncbi:unnamed protein product [Pieris macdunnoughi]|uniref:Uncharacterized protein n=1 Tax=Pieris macdunnoughi TaxID=345717 RepID=A0A821TS64_9NEOP|nr:unnamed protein product [Pieris macdunnoughi]
MIRLSESGGLSSGSGTLRKCHQFYDSPTSWRISTVIKYCPSMGSSVLAAPQMDLQKRRTAEIESLLSQGVLEENRRRLRPEMEQIKRLMVI